LIESLRSNPPDACIVDFDRDRLSAAQTAKLIHETFPETTIFWLSSGCAPDPAPKHILEAMQSGCSDYLMKPVIKFRVMEALADLQFRGSRPRAVKKGRLYTFMGSKGGTGVTALSTHLGVYAARQGAKTLLIDQHPDIGHVAVRLGQGEHQHHFYELVKASHRLDADLLQQHLVHHESGLDVLPAPESINHMVQASAAELGSTLAFLRELYDVVLLDCKLGLSAMNVSSIGSSDLLYLIGTPELPAVHNLAQYIDYLKRCECREEKIRVVLNRYAKRSALTKQEIEKAICMPVARVVPNDYSEMIDAIHADSPPRTRSRLAAVMRDWARCLTENG
jgi:pilus assembly protein CpaE